MLFWITACLWHTSHFVYSSCSCLISLSLLAQACSRICEHTQLRPADTSDDADAICVAQSPVGNAGMALFWRAEDTLLCQASLQVMSASEVDQTASRLLFASMTVASPC